MRIAVVAADPVMAECLACFLKYSAGHEVVHCSSHFGDMAALQFDRPELLVVTEGFDDPGHQLILKTAREAGTRVLAVVANRSQAAAANEADQVVIRSEGIGAFLAAVLMLERRGGTFVSEPRLAGYSAVAPHRSVSVTSQLTAREREAAEFVSQGLRDKEIASAMGTGEQNVKALVGRARRILGCKNRTELAILLNRERAAEDG